MTAGSRGPRFTSAGSEPEVPEAEVPHYAEDCGHEKAAAVTSWLHPEAGVFVVNEPAHFHRFLIGGNVGL